MDDYSALAQRVAVSVGEVRGCLILSRDGLILGGYPEDDETQAKPAWLRFAALGDLERSFVEFSDQIWVFCHRGAYSAFAVAGTSVRPGLLLDQLEQALLAAEEARTKREPLKLPDLNAAPSSKPRTTLHPVPADDKVEVSAEAPRNWPGGRTSASPGGAPPASWTEDPAAGDEADEPSAASGPAKKPAPEKPRTGLGKQPQKLVGSAGLDQEADEDEGEVDRVMLAKEFSGLLQMNENDDERNS